jgi:5'-phosphate synthase pdxT subunit
MEVKRNAFGRQVDSFEVDLRIPVMGEEPFHGIFIRAPIIQKTFDGVQTLCHLDKRPVVVKQGNIVAASFHPELTDDLRFHKYFIDVVMGRHDCKK